MTVIAYRAGIMACDSCWTYCDTQVASLPKIRRLTSGALLGQAGDNDSRNIDTLLDKIKDPRKLPTRQQLAETKCSFIGVLALPRGGIFIVSTGKHDGNGYPAEDEEDFGIWPATSMGGYCAVGSGSEAALAAMDAGATAREAAMIACKRNVHCRPPIHVMKLFPNKPKPKRGR